MKMKIAFVMFLSYIAAFCFVSAVRFMAQGDFGLWPMGYLGAGLLNFFAALDIALEHD